MSPNNHSWRFLEQTRLSGRFHWSFPVFPGYFSQNRDEIIALSCVSDSPLQRSNKTKRNLTKRKNAPLFAGRSGLEWNRDIIPLR
jgi:hypothetical protein